MQIRNRVRELRRVRAGELVPNPKNWRAHPKGQQDALRGILAEVGYADALLARELPDGRLMLVDGHLRAETTPDLEVPVLVLDLDEAEADKLLLSLDPLAALAETNAVALDALLREVDTGSEGLQQMYADLAEAAKLYQDDAKEVVEDEIPEPPADPITKPGDLWLLGDHRLLCGDSTKAEDVERLMAGAKADCMFTDPPYAIYGSSTGVSSSVADDKMVRPFFRDILALSKRNTKPFAHLYICCDFRSWASWWEIAKDVGLQVKNCIVWDKKTPGMGSMYQNQHEFVMFAVNHYQQTAHMSKRDGGQRLVTGKSNVWSISRAPVHEREHNATKPVELVALGLENSSDSGDLILEPFGGSGTTLIAAEQLGRTCYGMEISPAYCDVIVKRWETLAGKKAELEVNDGQARPATGADDSENRQGKPRQKAAERKRTKAAKR